MTINQKLKIAKFINTLLIVILIPIIIFYLIFIIPEYCACNNTMFEGEKRIDLWGDEIDCSGENQAFSKAFFQMFTMIISGISFALTVITIIYFNLKKLLESYNFNSVNENNVT